jgi:hypothetical protein
MAWVLVIHCNAKWPTLLTDLNRSS